MATSSGAGEASVHARHQRILPGRQALAAICLAGVLAAGPAAASCGYPQVLVEATEEEEALTCAALERVLGYFSDLGFAVAPQLRVVFIDELPLADDGIAFASFERARRTIEIARPGAPGTDDLRFWGLDWSAELVSAVLLHEIVHATVEQIAPDRIPFILAEFVGSAVQFELMDPALRARILGSSRRYSYAALGPELGLDFAIDPQSFGVRSYVYEQAHGGAGLIRDIVSGAVGLSSAGSTGTYPYPH